MVAITINLRNKIREDKKITFYKIVAVPALFYGREF